MALVHVDFQSLQIGLPGIPSSQVYEANSHIEWLHSQSLCHKSQVSKFLHGMPSQADPGAEVHAISFRNSLAFQILSLSHRFQSL